MTLTPDHRGRYYCAFNCHNPMSPYPAPHWMTLKGVEKHMAGCHMRPPDAYVPPPKPVPQFFGNCDSCGCVVLEMETIWDSGETFICYECILRLPVWPTGYLTGAGLRLWAGELGA